MRQRTIVCPLIQNEGTICSAKWLTIAAFFPGSGHFPAAA
jgi:hypothetical protein